ncbi:MAG: hypothetical protein MJZ65_02375 [Paludibacteraceae bacterium]|nr:hypothetical protein [Paludibacteraceae bacterium]
MIYNIILDMGGVLMQHNLPGCIAAFERLMGSERMQSVLGLSANGEGTYNSLMEQYERGSVSEEEFIRTIRENSLPGTTDEQVADAWVLMHGGIPQERLEQVRQWHNAGHHTLLLSNSNTLHKRDIETHYDMSMFDVCIYSHIVGASKPSPAIYDAVMQTLRDKGWDQNPTIFVDDIAANREMGERYGWRTFESLGEMRDPLGPPSKGEEN